MIARIRLVTTALLLTIIVPAGCPQPSPANGVGDSHAASGGPSRPAAGNPDLARPAPSLTWPVDEVVETSTELRWNPLPGAESYAIHLGTEDPPPLLIRIVDSHYVVELLSCTSYYWRVDARLADGGVVASTTGSFRTNCPTDWPAEPAYPAPANRAYGVSIDVALSSAAVERADRYELYLGERPDPPLVAGADSPEFANVQLAAGRTYYWRVIGVNKYGRRSSQEWTFTTTPAPSGPPAAVLWFPGHGTMGTPNRVRLAWRPSRGAARYAVYLGEGDNPPLLGETTEPWLITGVLALDTTYTWRVDAIGDDGVTPSQTQFFRTAAEPQRPLTPASPEPADGQVAVHPASTLNWTEIANATAYELHIATDDGTELVQTVEQPAYEPNAPLAAGAVHTWRVVAINDVGRTPGPVWRFVTSPNSTHGGSGGSGPAPDGPCGGSLVRASVRTGGGQSAGGVSHPSLSADGRYVAFASTAADLVNGDGNGAQDIFLHDLATASTIRVSVDSSGGEASDDCHWPAISADGSRVAFHTAAALVPHDLNGVADVYLHDVATHQTIWVSQNGEAFSGGPSLSANGRYVAFHSRSSNLVSGDTNDHADIFVRDMQTGTIQRASLGPQGQQGDGPADYADISEDGRYVSFMTAAANFGDPGGHSKVFVRDLQAGMTAFASVSGFAASLATISADGSRVAFSGRLGGDPSPQIYVRDVATGDLRLVSPSSGGGAGNAVAWLPAISGDGRRVAFASLASDHVTGDANDLMDIFRFDLDSQTMERLSVGASGGDADGMSFRPALAHAGGVAAFSSTATNLVTGDTNGTSDIFASECP